MKHLIIIAAFIASLAQAEGLSVYVGLATTHMDNEYVTNYYSDGVLTRTEESSLNNDNNLIAVKYNSFLAGHMTNSYHNESFMFGYQPTVASHGPFDLDVGVMGVTGYLRGQTGDYWFAFGGEGFNDEVLTVLPIVSISVSMTQHVALQANNMLDVFNVGVRIDF